MKITGERLTLNAGMYSELEWEHLHRYMAVTELVQGKRVLDAACGTGYGSKLLGQTAKEVYGIDISEEAIAYAQNVNKAPNVNFIQMSVADLKFDQKFDVIVSFETIEHIDEELQKKFLAKVVKYLEDDGILVISTPDKDILTKIIAHNYQNPFHIREFSYTEFQNFLRGYFNYVQFYYQNLIETSVISGKDSVSYNNHVIQNNVGVGKYLIAVCSQRELQNVEIAGIYIPDIKQYYMEKYSGTYSSLYIDTEKGYNEEEKITLKYIVVNGSFSVKYDVSEYHDIRHLRFDPCEQPCSIEITGIKANVGGVGLSASNAIKCVDERYYFSTSDPFFEVTGNKLAQIKTLEIDGNIQFLPYSEAEREVFNELNASRERQHALQQKIEGISHNLANRNEEISTLKEQLQNSCKERETQQKEIVFLKEREAQLDNELSLLSDVRNGLTDENETLRFKLKEERQAAQKSEERYIQENKSLVELTTSQNMQIAEQQRHAAYLEQYLYDIQHSTSWKVTAPLRRVKDLLKLCFNKRRWRLLIRKVYLAFPLPFSLKKRIKDIIFRILTPIIRNTETYKIWADRDKSYDAAGFKINNLLPTMNENGSWNSYIEQIMNIPFSKTSNSEYVQDISINTPIDIKETDIKYLAFYLPQYHPFKENDEWWGKGFTEWSNVTKAVPQFVGHYQPRLAGELGYYDLRNCDILRQQIELARKYGVYGFCIYYYWFDGKTLMEGPLKTLLSTPELSIPFCLCWANENWSRRWDGKENDILIAQNYNEDFPLKFIADAVQYMEDSRYIRINGKLLFIVYNANQIPNLARTLSIWRDYIRQKGLGEMHLLAVDFALTTDSKKAGFDGFIEFPPHSVYSYAMPDIDSSLSFINENCHSKVYDYQQIVHEKKYLEKDIDNYYKGLFLAWDNTARKPYSATVYHKYSPEAFKEWLKDISNITLEKRTPGDRLVFINAWNEWAEGTYLEPDVKYGYANLKAVRDTLVAMRSIQKKIIYVGHDAWFAGAQMLALKTIEELNRTYHYQVFTILKDSGSLLEKYKEVSEDVLIFKQTENDNILSWLKKTGATIALCNTVVTGDVLHFLTQQGIKCISMIHEMEKVIHQYSCEKNLSLINKDAHKIVFASSYVRNSVDMVEEINSDKVVIAPQGMYLVNTYLEEREKIRKEFREKYNLPLNAKIVLGVGYGYYRKGIDLFLTMASKMCCEDSRIAFVWVGDLDTDMQEFAQNLLKKSNCPERIILAGSQKDLMRFYTAADIFALTSREDPFPSVVMEALYTYLPVVAFESGGGFVDIVTSENGKLVPMENTNEMMREIKTLIENPDLLAQKGKKAHQTITEKYNFISYVGKLLSLLGEQYEAVSVVIPNYNYEKYLAKRIDSVLQQTYPVQEIIILDDFSTDGSREIIKSYQKKYPTKIRTIFNDTNSGNVFQQWERGFEAASGKYVWIAEADDLAEPDFLSTLVSKMESDDVTMSYSESVMINENGEKIGDNYLPWVADIDERLWKNDFVMDGNTFVSEVLSVKNAIPNVSAVLFRKQDFSSALKIAAEYKVAGDWMFYVQILGKYGKIAFSSAPLNYHRRHSNSVTTDLRSQKHFEEICSVQQYVAQKYYDSKLPKKAIAYREEVKDYLSIKS